LGVNIGNDEQKTSSCEGQNFTGAQSGTPQHDHHDASNGHPTAHRIELMMDVEWIMTSRAIVRRMRRYGWPEPANVCVLEPDTYQISSGSPLMFSPSVSTSYHGVVPKRWNLTAFLCSRQPERR
jgi:hypothetical protein